MPSTSIIIHAHKHNIIIIVMMLPCIILHIMSSAIIVDELHTLAVIFTPRVSCFVDIYWP